jgi:Flp pilus assembly pilin Flp
LLWGVPDKNVAVINGKVFLRFSGMTPSPQVYSLKVNKVPKSGQKRSSRKVHGAKEMKTIKVFLKDESGMETLEYAVIAGLIALAAVFVYGTSSTWRNELQNRLLNATTQS